MGIQRNGFSKNPFFSAFLLVGAMGCSHNLFHFHINCGADIHLRSVCDPRV
jgi:predicted membrane channel-forming protein YqfA (hemolysin III family)